MELDTFSAHRNDDRFTTIAADTTAVLVVDMLNDFCAVGGAMVLPGAERLIAPQNSIINAVRNNRGTVVFVNDAHRNALRRDREFLKREPHCLEGTWGAKVVDALDRRPEDIEVVKRRYSGFFNTDLDLTLKDMEIDTVIVVGVVTNICVRSTVHDAFFQGYRVFVPRDCVAATGPREQESSLYDIATHFGWVTGSADLVKALNEGTEIEGIQISV